ncbi:PC4 and SFRS1-interacting protein-like [Planococcus citri]|uniref:PC4 and SFRS1-interacting protein-like n=1 Tax=Planococcus citri TaxID=170843 RepID=UPI0031F7467F
MATIFHSGQKVFAKVRGYPPWPAKVLDCIDDTAGRQKYRVYFYGTRETATCKLEELYDYVEYRNKYGKPIKKKSFTEAIREIEAELEPSKRKDSVQANEPTSTTAPVAAPVAAAPDATVTPAAAAVPGDKDSDDEGNLVIDESPSQKAIKTKADPKQLKRKLSSGSIEVPAENSPVELTSRSGRKIKPKKFLDEPGEVFNTPTQSKPTRKSARETTNDKKAAADSSTADTPNSTTKVELRWEDTQNLKSLLNKTDNSDLPQKIKKDFKKSLKKRVEETKQASAEVYADNENLELIKIEVQLLDADCRIKSSLNLVSANCDECLQAMDEILDLKLNALMLKKHPEVVDTVKKLKKYVGNLSEWKLTREQEEAFIRGAEKIRAKAEHIYNKFQSLFTIPNGRNFFEVYSDEVAKFQEKTNNLPVNQLYRLVKEPIE